MPNELISVLMPAYNAERFIISSIKSILSQTYSNLELIIVNDGSADATGELVRTFEDKRIRYYERPHLGHAVQRNYALKKARGAYIAPMDADDVSDKARLKEQFTFLRNNPETQIVGSNYIFINEYDKEISVRKMPENHEDIEFMMPILCSVIHSAALFTKTSIENVGGYIEEDAPTLDQELFLRMLKAGYRFHNIQKPLYLYRQWNSSMTRNTLSIGKKISYGNGYNYILETSVNSKEEDKFGFYRRLGLLEYYKGSVREARSYFMKAMMISPLRIGNVIRFLIPSFMGDSIMNALRENDLSSRLNTLITRLVGWDPQQIRRIDGKKD